jgi:hypothetical protein
MEIIRRYSFNAFHLAIFARRLQFF